MFWTQCNFSNQWIPSLALASTSDKNLWCLLFVYLLVSQPETETKGWWALTWSLTWPVQPFRIRELIHKYLVLEQELNSDLQNTSRKSHCSHQLAGLEDFNSCRGLQWQALNLLRTMHAHLPPSMLKFNNNHHTCF